MMDLSALNPMQKQAAETLTGPVLILAGAGSGKTRTLTYRIANLISHGVKPWHILALTFTNKAAREMRERVERLVGEDAQDMWLGTFHSVCVRILRRDIEKLGYKRSFTIYDDDDQLRVIKDGLKTLRLDESRSQPKEMRTKISGAKNKMLTPDEWFRESLKDYQCQQFHDLYSYYEERLRAANALDFDDLLLRALQLFVDHPPVLDYYRQRFQYVLVDEYQDTNAAQYNFVRLLTEESRNLCVVGDDDQSIYGWRGADIRNILDFEKDYPDARVIKLEQNYRSTANILDAANQVIAHNVGRKEKALWTDAGEGEKIHLYSAGDEREEAAWICERIKRLRQAQTPYAQMAVLYRNHSLSRVIEEMLTRSGIPYKVFGGTRFYDRKEVRDVLAYFRLIVNPNDEEAFKRIVNYPSRGIGDVTLGKVVRAAAEQNCGVWDVLERPKELGLDVSAGTLGKLEKFRAMMADFMQVRDQADAYVLGNRVIRESGLHGEAYRNNLPENKEMQDNLSELLNGMHAFVELQREVGDSEHVFLADYLSEVALLSDTDDRETEGKDMVTLMTVHAAKGLEFDAIFVAGMEENLFPNAMSMNSQRELEEERRLFYVAITRARKYCFLSCAKMRFRYGSMDFCEPSRFLKEIDKRFIRMEMKSEPKGSDRGFGGTSSRFAETTANKRSGLSAVGPAMPVAPRRLRPMPSNNDVKTEGESHQSLHTPNGVIRVGQHVVHDRFGEGSVLALEGTNEMVKARIRFVNMGEKTLLLKFAKLKFLD